MFCVIIKSMRAKAMMMVRLVIVRVDDDSEFTVMAQ